MSKSSRCTTDEVYVVGFVPTYLLPNKTPISLDPFLEPLIRDIENGFINGNSILLYKKDYRKEYWGRGTCHRLQSNKN